MEAPVVDPDFLRLERIVQAHCEQVVKQTRGNVSRAAKLLGIDRRTLQRKIVAWKAEAAAPPFEKAGES